MKVIRLHFKNTLNLIDVIANALGGIAEGNFVKGNNSLYHGTHLILDVEEGISAMVFDTSYREKVILETRIDNEEVIGLYYYLTDKDFDCVLNDQTKLVGKLSYNLSIVGAGIPTNYLIKKGTHTYTICIYINKRLFKNYLSKLTLSQQYRQTVFDSNEKALMHLDRMGNKSFNLINDFRLLSYDSPLYEMHFVGLIYQLISNYLEELPQKKVMISNVINEDVRSIILSKALMLNMIEGDFPGIEFLADKVSMSPTKYKKLFTKMTGVSPGAFFSYNKLHHAKKLLETGAFTISELAEKLSYYNDSYFAKRFFIEYGVCPKEYQSLF